MELNQGCSEEGFLLSTSQGPVRAYCVMNTFCKIPHKCTRFSTHTWWMWPPSLVWLVPPCRVKKTSSQPFIPVSVSHFHILLFTHSFSLSFSRPLILLLTTLFSAGPGWLPLHGGSRVRALLLEQLLVELKRVPVTPPPFLSPPPFVHPAALSSSRPHCLEREGASGGKRQKGREGIQMCENV